METTFILTLENGMQLEIYGKKAPTLILSFLISFAFAIFLVPILILCYLLHIGEGIPFATILTWIIAWLVSGYLTKLYLWNKYGKEVFIVKDNLFRHYYDYHLFKDNHIMYQFKKIAIYVNKKGQMEKISPQKHIKNGESHIVAFKVDKQFVNSYNTLPMSIINQIALYYEDS